MMLDKPLDQISLDDLNALVTNEVQEGKAIEYKRELYRLDAPDHEFKLKQHEELLKDVSSFANTVGGHLVLGIKEDKGIPTEVCGVDCEDPDALKLRLIQILEQGLEPRANFTIHAVPKDANKYVLVIYVTQSLVAPHRVVFRGQFGQFWARNSGGAYRMDTSELRQSFTFSATVFDQIKAFRSDRTRLIVAGETPLPMPSGAKLILHLIPQESFSARHSFAPTTLEAFIASLRPLASTVGSNHRFNMDGIVTFDGGDYRRESLGYVQLFRNGIVEVVADDITYSNDGDQTNTRCFRKHYEHCLVKSLPNYLQCISDLGVAPPVWCFLTLTGVKGVTIHHRRAFGPMPPMDRDVLQLPEVEITDMASRPLDILRPLLDMIWNAAGLPKCLSFDDEGRWHGD